MGGGGKEERGGGGERERREVVKEREGGRKDSKFTSFQPKTDCTVPLLFSL